jgi:uncharacterized cupin superfamily protein
VLGLAPDPHLMTNLFDPEVEPDQDWEGFRARRVSFGRLLGAQSLGASLWELDPGESAYPYHAHLAEEELLVVLEGRPSVRDPSGWRELEPGEIVLFPAGAQGAHQLTNRSAETLRFLVVSNQPGVDIVLLPDSGKLGAQKRAIDGNSFRHYFRIADAVTYREGETGPLP